MIEVVLTNANIEVGDFTGPGPDGESISGKVMRITVPVTFVLPMQEEAAKQIGSHLATSGVVIASAGSVPPLKVE